MFKKICEVFPSNRDRVYSYYRVRNGTNKGPILVKFISNVNKKDFVRKVKEKTEIPSSALSEKIYITEMMSSLTYNLYKHLKSIQ